MNVSPSLICRSAELGTVHKSALQGSAAGAGASTFFVPKSRKGVHPLSAPPVLWQGSFPLFLSPGPGLCRAALLHLHPSWWSLFLSWASEAFLLVLRGSGVGVLIITLPG